MSAFDAQMPRVPVLLVTGFLGSGKTTLVNRLLKLGDFSRAAVVVNEYGEVSIDHMLVEAPRYRMRVVDSGCLCGHPNQKDPGCCEPGSECCGNITEWGCC